MTLRTKQTRNALKTFAYAAALTLAGLLSPQSASAQGLDFLWGGDEDHGGGRTTIGFSSQYKPGQVIVSFGDRRLYLVTKPGQALSYPIAVPRTQSRWQGTTFVSDKCINPAWTPTPEMIRENPRLPRGVPGGHPMNPLGVRAMYLGSSSYRIHGTDAPWLSALGLATVMAYGLFGSAPMTGAGVDRICADTPSATAPAMSPPIADPKMVLIMIVSPLTTITYKACASVYRRKTTSCEDESQGSQTRSWDGCAAYRTAQQLFRAARTGRKASSRGRPIADHLGRNHPRETDAK